MSERAKSHPVWRAAKITLGVLLIPLGIVGLFLPFLQGVLFLLVGFALLANEVPFLQRLRDRLRDRYPAAWARLENARERMQDWLRARFGRQRRHGHEGRQGRSL